MNENVRIKVQTPVGLTKEEDIGPTVSQGSVDAAVISSVSIAGGIEEAFEDSEMEVVYHELPLGPTIFHGIFE